MVNFPAKFLEHPDRERDKGGNVLLELELALVHKPQGNGEVVEGDPRGDSGGEERVDLLVVVLDGGCVVFSLARLDLGEREV